MHGKALDEASGLHASGIGAIALLRCTMPSVLSVAVIRRHERDDLLPPADFPAHVRGCALPSDPPRHHRLPEGPSAIVGCSSLGPEKSLGWRTSVCGSSRAKSRSLLPASPSSLFLIPVGYKRMATFGGHACVSLPTALRGIIPEGGGVLCVKSIILISNLEIPAVMAMLAF